MSPSHEAARARALGVHHARLIAFTRMLRGPSSEASVRVSESTAALVAL
jgi:hypothetical protein